MTVSPGSVHHPDDVAWHALAPGIELPEAFTYREQPRDGAPDATLHMRVVDGDVVCERIELEPADGPLTAIAIRRLQLGRMLRNAPVAAAHVTMLQPEPESPNAAYWHRQQLAVAEMARQRGTKDPVRAATQPRHARHPIPMDDRGLTRVAEIYRTATSIGHHPTATVQDKYKVSRATASRWVRRARDRGLLDPT